MPEENFAFPPDGFWLGPPNPIAASNMN
jgi:hypothetical protein